LDEVREIVSAHLEEMHDLFTAGMDVAFVAFDPSNTEMTFLLTSCERLEDLEKAIRDRRLAE